MGAGPDTVHLRMRRGNQDDAPCTAGLEAGVSGGVPRRRESDRLEGARHHRWTHELVQRAVEENRPPLRGYWRNDAEFARARQTYTRRRRLMAAGKRMGQPLTWEDASRFDEAHQDELRAHRAARALALPPGALVAKNDVTPDNGATPAREGTWARIKRWLAARLRR